MLLVQIFFPSFFLFFLTKRGTAWGESGYMRLKRTASGLCGILTSPFYPVAGNTTATL
jgi:hypothetical protein